MGCVSPSSYIWKSYEQMRSVCAQAHSHDKQQHCDFCLISMAPATLLSWVPFCMNSASAILYSNMNPKMLSFAMPMIFLPFFLRLL